MSAAKNVTPEVESTSATAEAFAATGDDYSPEDLRLPWSAVTRIAKEAIPPGTAIGKDAKSALARSAAVFILNLTTFANENAAKGKRKMINGNDVLAAVKSLDCGANFEETLKEGQAKFQERRQAKNDLKKKKASTKDSTGDEERPESPEVLEDDENGN